MAAISFLYREVLGSPVEELEPIARAKRAVRLPVVLTSAEVKQLIARMDGTPQLVVMLLYGTGLRVLECLKLREGCGFCRSRDHGAGWQGGQRSSYDAPDIGGRCPARPHGSGARVTCAGPEAGWWESGHPERIGAEVSKGIDRMEVAVCVPGGQELYRQGEPRTEEASSPCDGGSACGSGGGAGVGAGEAGDMPHLQALIRDALNRERL
jgi:hypothetical protein